MLGAKVFSNTCAACHAGGQNIVEADKTLEKAALETYLAGGFNEGAIVTQVSGGRRSGGGGGGARFAVAPVLTAPPRVWAPVLREQGEREREARSVRVERETRKKKEKKTSPSLSGHQRQGRDAGVGRPAVA